MGVSDLDARFDAVAVADNSVARTAIDKIHTAASAINDLVTGEPWQLVTVIQALEVAAHQSGTLLNFPPDQQPGEDPAPPVAYEDMSLDDLKAELQRRKDAGRNVAVSGNKTELAQRLQEDDES